MIKDLAKFKKPKNSIPIKYFLNIPIIQCTMRDEQGNELTDITNVQSWKNGIVVIAGGKLYSNVDLGSGKMKEHE